MLHTLGTACGGADGAATVYRPYMGDAIPVAESTRNTLATVSRRSSTSTRCQLAGHRESRIAANEQSARRHPTVNPTSDAAQNR